MTAQQAGALVGKAMADRLFKERAAKGRVELSREEVAALVGAAFELGVEKAPEVTR